jgi:hypothetical protein
MTNYFPVVTAATASIFMTLLLYKYSTTKKNYHLVWTVAIFMVFLTSLLEFFSEVDIWNEVSYKAYYVQTAPLVALMGLGTLYLLTHKNWSKYFLYYAVAVSAVFIIAGATATVNEAAFASGSQIGGTAMPSYVRALSPLLTVPGGLILIGGAFLSFWLDRTRKYNILIGFGGLLYMVAGSLARAGILELFYAIQMISLLLLFSGFLLSMEYSAKVKLKSADAKNISS